MDASAPHPAVPSGATAPPSFGRRKERGPLMKRLLRVLIVITGIIVIVAVAARFYLRSQRVHDQVTSEIEALYGGPVKVAEVEIGLGGTTLSGFELFEEGAQTSEQPWLKVESLTTDLSLFALMSGNTTPQDVSITGASVTLRFDDKGRLTTRFPGQRRKAATPSGERVGSLPHIELKNSQITLQRAGSPDLVIKAVNAALRQEGEQFVLSGNAEHPQWGQWRLAGEFGRDASQINVKLHTESRVEVTRGMLEGLPFVPAVVWKEVEVEQGNTSLAVTLRYDLKEKAVNYLVEMDPRDTTLRVPAIDLRATGAEGGLLIDNGLVQLRKVQGQAFQGKLRTDADLDFRGAVTRLSFPKVEAEALKVSDLPKSWKFPPQIKGRLSGEASVNVTIIPGHATPMAATSSVGSVGVPPLTNLVLLASASLAEPLESKVVTRGQGKGQITEATVAGQPAEELTIELHAVPGGFRFGSQPAKVSSGVRAASPGLALLPALAQEKETPKPADLSARVANALAGGVDQVLQSILDTGSGLVARLPEKFTPRKPGDPPNYLEINLKMKQVNLAEFVKGLGVRLPFDVAGKLTFQVKAALPIDQPGELKLYRVNGSAQVTQFELAGVKLDDLETELVYADGVLRMPALKGRISDAASVKESAATGTLHGTGEFQLVPMGDLTANVTLDQIPLTQVGQMLKAEQALSGSVSGTLSARAPGAELKNLEAWGAKGKLTAKKLAVLGLSFQDGRADVNLSKGTFAVTELRAALEGAPVSATGQIRLAGNYPLQATAALKGWDLATLERLAPQWRPPLDLAGTFSITADLKGTLQPLKVEASGTSAAREVRVGDFRVQDAKFHWALGGDRLTVKNAQAELYGGAATGTAVIPLDPKVGGSVALSVKGLNVGELTKDLPKMPVRMQGEVQGELKGKLAPAAPGEERAVTLTLELKAPKFRVQGIPTEQLQGAIDYQKGVIDYRLEGKTLGGSFELEGQVPPAPADKKVKQGRLRIKGVQIGRLLEALKMQGDVAALRGLVDVELTYQHEGPDRLPVGSGRLKLSNIRWRDVEVAGTLGGDLALTGSQLRLKQLTGTYAGGILRAQLGLSLKQLERSFFSISLDNAEASEVLGPWIGETIQGPIQARLRGTLGAEWYGSGDLELARGKILDIEVTGWRMPFTWRLAPGYGRGQLDALETGAQVARGRVNGRLSLRMEDRLVVEGQLKFGSVDLQTLLQQAFDVNQLGRGQMTGRFDFAGRDVRTLDDLSGTLEASFGQTQAFRFPVLQQVSPLLGIGSSTTFDKGHIQARLDRGVFRIQRLSLEGGLYRVFIDGTVTTAGRLNLDVVARSGPAGLDANRLRFLGLRVPMFGPLPLTLLREANDFLANRVIHLRVTGTVRSPTIRVQPLATLTQEAVRYFLTGQGIPLP
jgi:translocation and assembly module TamB